ncbi:hypothetical protein [Prosthecochloris sp. GSB1]|uniref:hypothetical protein n=1 Tax=Prosthecochloris sp. GSB1 TaxID=281093 RepID=UPI0012372C20|nr:hypothetical protein [Prosthecochloris sp. GSB1]
MKPQRPCVRIFPPSQSAAKDSHPPIPDFSPEMTASLFFESFFPGSFSGKNEATADATAVFRTGFRFRIKKPRYVLIEESTKIHIRIIS